MIVSVWVVWSAGAGIEIIAQSDQVRFAAVQLQNLCSMLAAPTELFFALNYTGHRKWLTSRHVALIVTPGIVLVVLMLSNPLRHLFWSEIRYGAEIAGARTPMLWGAIFYHYLLWLASIGVLLNCMLRAPAFTAPILLLIGGQMVPRIFFLTTSPLMTSLSPMQMALLASNATALAYFMALYNFRLLRVLPVARDVVLDCLSYGVVVVDAEDRLVDINPAAWTLLGLKDQVIVGQAASQVLGDWWQRLSSLSRQEPAWKEVIVDAEGRQQVVDIQSLPLFHTNGWQMGQVFVINDITAAWQARRRLVKQQWAEATLQEREQLAHELHDGLSQNLAFVNVQAQAAQIYLQTGQPDVAKACLDRLVEVSCQIQGDTREMIGQLMSISMPAEGFIASLRQVLNGFEQQTGLRTVLLTDAQAEAACNPNVLDPAVVVQLLRIIQEALANARKHAHHAHTINVRLAVQDGQMRLTIEDDGAGFDPALVSSSSSRHFGLKVMRQRAVRIGARLNIHSNIGRGTQVEVCVPIDGIRTRHEDSSGR